MNNSYIKVRGANFIKIRLGIETNVKLILISTHQNHVTTIIQYIHDHTWLNNNKLKGLRGYPQHFPMSCI